MARQLHLLVGSCTFSALATNEQFTQQTRAVLFQLKPDLHGQVVGPVASPFVFAIAEQEILQVSVAESQVKPVMQLQVLGGLEELAVL